MLHPYKEIERQIASCETLKDCTKTLENLLSGGFSVWEDGSLYNIRQLVSQVKGLRIEIYSREHPPPHFHVTGGDINAVFSITDCKLISGNVGRREKELIEWWYKNTRSILIQTWNETRPSGCPVGPMKD